MARELSTDQQETLRQALALRRLGLSVFPVPRPGARLNDGRVADGKRPVLQWKPFQSRKASEDEIRRWFREPQNIAVATGALSEVVVVDADSQAGLRFCTRRLPHTPWQTQTSRGFHLFYRHPGVRVPNSARLHTQAGDLAVDVRGDGGYVIAPGSRHSSGLPYIAAGDWSVPLSGIPRFWPGWLRAPRIGNSPPQRPPSAAVDLLDRGRLYLNAVPVPEVGCGSDSTTLRVACRLVRGFGLSPADTEALIWEWAGNRPGWTRDWVASKVQNAIRYGSEPIGALR